MITAMIIAASVSQLTPTTADEPAILSSQFDLATISAEAEQARQLRDRARYLPQDLPDLDDDPDEGIELRLKWRRVRLRMPIPSI